MAEIEEATEVISEIAEQTAQLTPREIKCLLFGIGGGILCGALAGFFVTRRQLETKYREIAESEILELRTFYNAARTDPLKPELEKLVDHLGYSGPNTSPTITEGIELEEPQDDEEESKEVEEEPQVVEAEHEAEDEEEAADLQMMRKELEHTGAVKDPEEDWNYEEEIAQRSTDKPYVIHVDELHERDYDELSYTYYEGDDILADEEDKVIEDVELIVGADNLDKFGHGSKDKEIVYIRNDKLAIEAEIVRNDGTFAEIVHGFEPANRPRPTRKRRHIFEDVDGE